MSDRHSLLVAGVGNIFLGDDAFGVEVVRRLRERSDLGCAKIVDFGIRALDLAYALARARAAIVIDLVSRGGAPGTLYVLEPDAAFASGPVDPHAMTPDRALAWSAPDVRPEFMRIVGCEPATMVPDFDGRLSAAVDRAADEAVRIVMSLVRQWEDGEVAHA